MARTEMNLIAVRLVSRHLLKRFIQRLGLESEWKVGLLLLELLRRQQVEINVFRFLKLVLSCYLLC